MSPIRLNIDIDKDLKSELHVLAIKQGLTLKSLVGYVLRGWVNAYKGDFNAKKPAVGNRKDR